MRIGLLLAACLLASLVAPTQTAAACAVPLVPAYPGAQQISGYVGQAAAAWLPQGRSTWVTDAPLLAIQQFYYTRLSGDGWNGVPQLPGTYPDQFSTPLQPPINVPQPVLEFQCGGDRELIRIVTEAGGYSVWLECRD